MQSVFLQSAHRQPQLTAAGFGVRPITAVTDLTGASMPPSVSVRPMAFGAPRRSKTAPCSERGRSPYPGGKPRREPQFFLLVTGGQFRLAAVAKAFDQRGSGGVQRDGARRAGSCCPKDQPVDPGAQGGGKEQSAFTACKEFYKVGASGFYGAEKQLARRLPDGHFTRGAARLGGVLHFLRAARYKRERSIVRLAANAQVAAGFQKVDGHFSLLRMFERQA